jgi:signal transduction histidine kinase
VDGDAYRRLLDGAGVGLAEIDDRGVIVHANARLLAMCGRDDLVGTALRDLVHEADRHALDRPHPVEVRIGERWVSVEVTSSGIASFTDVTERQEQLRHAQHDVNNMLTVILSHAAVLLRRGGLAEHAQTHHAQIIAASERASTLTRSIYMPRAERVASGTEPPAIVDPSRRR